MITINIPGAALYAIHDIMLNGFITWFENKHGVEIRGILLFTTGEKCENYIHKVMPARVEHVSVCKVPRRKMQAFVAQMVTSGIDYALIDVPPIVVDQFSEGVDLAERELIREYGIVDLKKLHARFGR